MADGLIEIKGAGISLRGLTKRYGEVDVVDDITLEIEAGEFVTLLGPSGSGKTTTLMMIAGFVVPTQGDILIDGRSIIGMPASKRNLGMVFQNYSLFPHMNVYSNIAFPLEMRRVNQKEIRARVGPALELVRLPGFERRRVNQLSGGQQQRIALARALVYEPAVLLLDEPLGALDLKLRQEMQIELLQLHERLGITIIFVTHDQGEALTMSDRIVVMNTGMIQQVGTPEELYKKPVNRFVVDFIGESNIISGVARFDNTHFVLNTDDGLRLIGVGGDGGGNLGRTTVVVRPESIVPISKHDCLSNMFDGEVQEVIYLGDVVKYTIRIGPDTTVVAKWLVRSSIGVMTRGDRVRIGWAAEDMVPV